MTEKTKIFLKKELIDVAFSVLSFILLVALYLGIGKISDKITGATGDSSAFLFTSIISFLQTVCLGVNLLIQSILNITLARNKTKYYVFFVALIMDVLCFNLLLLLTGAGIISYIILLSFAFIFIKFLIAKYYYKTLNNYDQKRII